MSSDTSGNVGNISEEMYNNFHPHSHIMLRGQKSIQIITTSPNKSIDIPNYYLFSKKFSKRVIYHIYESYL